MYGLWSGPVPRLLQALRPYFPISRFRLLSISIVGNFEVINSYHACQLLRLNYIGDSDRDHDQNPYIAQKLVLPSKLVLTFEN